jgi:hypothetical protein
MVLGHLIGVPYEILLLTAVTWMNSLGDLVADLSIARRGYTQMAVSAAIGGPLFSESGNTLHSGDCNCLLLLIIRFTRRLRLNVRASQTPRQDRDTGCGRGGEDNVRHTCSGALLHIDTPARI